MIIQSQGKIVYVDKAGVHSNSKWKRIFHFIWDALYLDRSISILDKLVKGDFQVWKLMLRFLQISLKNLQKIFRWKDFTSGMESPLWIRWLKVWAYGGVIVATGCLLFKYTTPTDEELINSLSPELRMQYEREKSLRQAEQQELMKIARRTSQSNDPIWKTGSIQSPWETSESPRFKNRQQFDKLKADQVQKEELHRINEELMKIRKEKVNEVQRITDNKNSSWWKFWQ